MHCLILSSSAAVKVSAIQNAENVARKVVKMFKISAKKTALLKSCIKEDVSSQGRNYVSRGPGANICYGAPIFNNIFFYYVISLIKYTS